MTIGFGKRTILGVYVDTRRYVLNVLAFGWHYQIQTNVIRYRRN
jgi:hypothetical protein